MFKLFISHKHVDRDIGEVLARFITANSGGRVDIHLSSSPRYRGPDPGGRLKGQLQKTLWETEGFILIYTTEDKDWSYCMWECGTAIHPASPATKLFVLQCGSKAPAPFTEDVLSRARSIEDLQRFVRVFFCELPFPNQTEPLCPGWERDNVERAAQELSNGLDKILPSHDYSLVDDWSSWPWLELTMTSTAVAETKNVADPERVPRMIQALRSEASVKRANTEAGHLFGQSATKSATTFGDLVASWENDSKKPADTWLGGLAEQVINGLDQRMVVLHRRPIQCPRTARRLQPVLSSVSRIEATAKFDVELLFIDLADPRSILVVDRMIPLDNAFYKTIDGRAPEAITLLGLRNELVCSGRNRVPLIWRDRTPAYVVHLSMIDHFLVENAINGQAKRADELTVADIFKDDHYRPMFENTFAVVDKQATLADAQRAMRERHAACRDLFVTEGGKVGEEILGWLTNVDALA